MKTRITPISLFACAMAFLAFPVPAYAMEGEHMMMEDDMMNMSTGGNMTVPMVEMPPGMSMRSIPESMVMMMDTPRGKRAFVPWYLTPEYAEMLQSMEGGDMAEGVMMRAPNGRFVFVPWYLSPQFAEMISSEEQMGRGMKMMEDDEGMSYLYVPWYKRR